MAQVKWVYARHMCAITGAGNRVGRLGTRASGPIAVRLGDAPLVRVPTPGAGYPERVRQVIPERYHEEAFGEFADEDAIEAARRGSPWWRPMSGGPMSGVASHADAAGRAGDLAAGRVHAIRAGWCHGTVASVTVEAPPPHLPVAICRFIYRSDSRR